MSKEYKDFIVQRYEKTGVCDDTNQLIVIFQRYGDEHVMAQKALRSFDNSVRRLKYVEADDYYRTENTYRKLAEASDYNTIEWKVYTHAANLFRKKYEKYYDLDVFKRWHIGTFSHFSCVDWIEEVNRNLGTKYSNRYQVTEKEWRKLMKIYIASGEYKTKIVFGI